MERITDISQLDPNGTYTYADYLRWQFDETVELIKGKIFRMSPAPLTAHQLISGAVYGEIYPFFKRKPCRVVEAPFDVRLPNPEYPVTSDKIYTVVQPDICVICDRSKLDRRGCLGAPDWIVEITSAATMKKDFREKFNLYEENGVQEYWIIVPEQKSIQQYVLSQGKYALQELFEYNLEPSSQRITPALFPELTIELEDIFGDLE
ncbi:MAG: Uma2 family endonuclease [Cytophagaceae bacterium]|nr:Uma2 family endonuclease [Cytophagaceae bacterium]